MYKILKGGCGARHPLSYRMSRPEGLPHYVLLIIRTGGKFIINKAQYTVQPGHALLLSPNTGYSYYNPAGEYIDDWLHFLPTDDEYFQQKYPISNQPFPIGNTETYTFYIKQLLWEVTYTAEPFSSQNQNTLFTILLNHLLLAYEKRELPHFHSPYEQKLQELRLDLQNNPSIPHSLDDYAGRLGISKSYFQHLYTELFNISFQQDIIQFRMEHARYLLTTTDLALSQIAEICGYNNDVHFYRQFKQLTSITPAQYRKRSLNIPPS